MAARQLAASAKNLVIVRQRESATETRVTETEKRTETRTEIRTEIGTATVTGKGKGTATETATVTMTVTVIATVNANATVIVRGTEIVTVTATAIVRGSETVALGTTEGMTTTHDGHRVTTVAIVTEIGRVTHHETVVTETEISMLREGQVRERTIGNGVQEGTGRTTEAAMMSRERSARQRTTSEARKCVRFSFSHASHSIPDVHLQRARYDAEAPSHKDRKSRAETPEEGEI
jgi:hypothetical protein